MTGFCARPRDGAKDSINFGRSLVMSKKTPSSAILAPSGEGWREKEWENVCPLDVF